MIDFIVLVFRRIYPTIIDYMLSGTESIQRNPGTWVSLI
jgi:hypothetical protein